MIGGVVVGEAGEDPRASPPSRKSCAANLIGQDGKRDPTLSPLLFSPLSLFPSLSLPLFLLFFFLLRGGSGACLPTTSCYLHRLIDDYDGNM